MRLANVLFDWARTIGLYLCFGLPAVESKIWNRKVASCFLWCTTGTISINEQPKEGLGVVFCQESHYLLRSDKVSSANNLGKVDQLGN